VKRTKLTLDPERQLRRRPPTGFSTSTGGDRHSQAPAQAASVPGGARRPTPAQTASPAPEDALAAAARPDPAGHPKTSAATGAANGAGRRRIDRGRLVGALLVAGVAALSIILLKRRLF
jgi:hypothetical protein